MVGFGLKNQDYMRWTGLRTWFPALWFLVYWINSFLNYHFGFVINPPLHFNTIFYLVSSMALFIWGYSLGLGRPHRVRITSPAAVYQMNKSFFRYKKILTVMLVLGVLGLIIGLYVGGGASIYKTMNELEGLREELGYHMTPITTLSMIPFTFSLFSMALIFVGTAIGVLPRKYYICIFVFYAGLCFISFLSGNRGNFVSVVAFALFDLLFVKGVPLWKLMIAFRWLWLRLVAVGFAVVACIYFIFVARNRGIDNDSYLDITTSNFKTADRYGIYSWYPGDDRDCSAFLNAYTYCCNGYDSIDYFTQKAEIFAFRPIMFIGDRTLRQFNRFLPRGFKIVQTAGVVGNEWRRQAGITIYGWPTVWGWTLAMFGYVGAPIFFFLLGAWIGFASGEFVRFGNIGGLLVCFGVFCILMTSYNGWGGDIPHQLAIWGGAIMLFNARKRRLRFYQMGYIR